MKPLNNRIVVRPDPKKNQTESGFILPESALADQPVIATVVVSSYDEPKVGDRVLLSRFGYDEVEIDKETLGVVSIHNVLAIL